MLRPDTDSVIVSMTVVAAAILAAIVAAVVWWETPELHVDTSSRPAVAHMELLGDYPSDIRSIEITRGDQSAPVWKIVARGDRFQIHSVPLTVGDNPGEVHLFWGESRRVVPESAMTFRLEAGIAYRMKICPASVLGLCRSARFTLQRA